MQLLILLAFLVEISNSLLSIPIKRIYSNNGQTKTLKLYDDSIYVGNISIGTPSQTFKVQFGTLNSDFFVVDSSCSETQCKGFPESGYTKNVYNQGASSTCEVSGGNFSINFGSGPCSGPVITDTLTLLDYTYSNQTFGSASTVPEVFGYVPFDGILGLGLTPSEDNGITPVIQNLLDQFPQKLFTIWLDRQGGTSSGLITLGALDETNCDPEITYIPLTSKSFWQFGIDKFAYDSYMSQKSAQAISDMATAFIGAPSAALRAITKTLHADYDSTYQFYTVSCDLIDTVPKMLFTIGGKEMFVEGKEYIIDIGIGDGKCAVTVFDMSDASFSVDWIMSAPFIRAYCNVYSIGNNQIGFTRARHS